MALESTQPLTEMSTRDLPGGKCRSVREADNLAIISQPYGPSQSVTVHSVCTDNILMWLYEF
jgi:hypothetical protein